MVSMVVFLACGTGGGGDDDDDDDQTYTLSFPLMDGVSWTYDCVKTFPDSLGVPDSNYVLVKSIDGLVVPPFDTIGYVQPSYPPTLAWFRQYDADSSFFFNDGNYAWFGQMDPTIAGFGANPFVPLRVVPLSFTIGDTFTTLVHKQIGPLSANITFHIEVAGVENVTVPAGTFNNCARLEMILAVSFGNDTTLSTLWCANNIGVVKRHDYYDTNKGETYYEELTSYDVTP